MRSSWLRKIKQAGRRYRYLKNDVLHLLAQDDAYLLQARGARIVTYHGICRKDHTRFNASFLTLDIFERHLRYYRQYFNVVSLADYYARNLSNEQYNICLTFDDGYLNNLTYVLPLLEKYKLPATFFITGIRNAGYDILWNDFLAMFGRYGPRSLKYKNILYHKNSWNRYIAAGSNIALQDIIRNGAFDLKIELMETLKPFFDFRANTNDQDFWQLMTEHDIKKLSLSSYATIGAHSLHHNDLTVLPQQELQADLVASKNYFEGIINKEIIALAFPYGAYNPSVIAMAKKQGFHQLLALDLLQHNDNADDTLRPRLVVNPYISVANQMRAIISGTYE